MNSIVAIVGSIVFPTTKLKKNPPNPRNNPKKAFAYNSDLVRAAVAQYGDKIAVGIDAKNGKVAVSGWLEVSETDFLTMAKEMEALGVKTIIYTDISKDGTLKGPTLDDYQLLQQAVPNINIIASGGVASKQDLIDLEALDLFGAIVGKAYYSNKVSLTEMLEVHQNVS